MVIVERSTQHLYDNFVLRLNRPVSDSSRFNASFFFLLRSLHVVCYSASRKWSEKPYAFNKSVPIRRSL